MSESKHHYQDNKDKKRDKSEEYKQAAMDNLVGWQKALADYLYFAALGKKAYNDRLNIAFLNKEKLFAYAQLYQKPKIIKLLKKLL